MNCKNCTKHKGDCGHHFIDGDEHIHYDIPAESSCDRYGDCSFYTERRSRFQIQIDLLNEKRHRAGRFERRRIERSTGMCIKKRKKGVIKSHEVP